MPGIGRKTAERVLLEIGDRLAALGAGAAAGGTGGGSAPVDVREDVISALTNLGYSERLAAEAVRRATRGPADRPEPSFEALLKRTLGLLAR